MTSAVNEFESIKSYYIETFVKKLNQKLSQAEQAFLNFFESHCKTAPSALAIQQAHTLQKQAQNP